MSTKLSKDDVKSPDQVLKTLNQGFQWSQNHSRALITALIAFIVIGVGYSIYAGMSSKKETEAQAAYFRYEKSYLDKKRDFEEAERGSQRPPTAGQPAPKAKASGELDKDYGPEVTGFQQILKDHPSSKAAQMAALNLSDLFLSYKKPDDALNTLKAVESQSGGKDLISLLVLSQYGNVLSDKGDCKAAVDQWQKVINRKEASFLHDSLRLKSGFCYEQMNDLAKAEEMYKKVSQNSQNTANPEAGEVGLGKDAEKYLRLLKLKKNAG